MATHEEINQKLAEGIFKELSVIEAKAAALENVSSDFRWGFQQGANWALACLENGLGETVPHCEAGPNWCPICLKEICVGVKR